jgi:aryl-alcohol dehydrogenase-like predicted oxidoreductase
MTESVKKCYDMGINFFDTAENYSAGVSETMLGNAFKALNVPRKNIVVSTKLIRLGMGP